MEGWKIYIEKLHSPLIFDLLISPLAVITCEKKNLSSISSISAQMTELYR